MRNKAPVSLADVASGLDVQDLSVLDVDALKSVTRARLLAASRALGLKGVSALRKQKLATRVWEVLHRELEVGSPDKRERAFHGVTVGIAFARCRSTRIASSLIGR